MLHTIVTLGASGCIVVGGRGEPRSWLEAAMVPLLVQARSHRRVLDPRVNLTETIPPTVPSRRTC